MWKETETGKVGFRRLLPVSEVNSKPANPFEMKGNLAAELAAVGIRKGELAEGMRFELTVRVDPVQRFSKPPPSATRPPLRRRAHPRTASLDGPDTAFVQSFYVYPDPASNP